MNNQDHPNLYSIRQNFDFIVIGGSAGSFASIRKILEVIAKDFNIPIMMCLHRLKNKREGFAETLNFFSKLEVIEPQDKSIIQKGKAFLAPANYHLLVEDKQHFSLSEDEPIHFSRPSIDLAFDSASEVYEHKLLAILLSGANTDGTFGVQQVKKRGGTIIVQDPNDCLIKTMTESAIKKSLIDFVLTEVEIVKLFQKKLT